MLFLIDLEATLDVQWANFDEHFNVKEFVKGRDWCLILKALHENRSEVLTEFARK